MTNKLLQFATSADVLDPFQDWCPFCLGDLRRGVPEDGECGHEELLNTYPHLRFNASDRLDAATLEDSAKRFKAAYSGEPLTPETDAERAT